MPSDVHCSDLWQEGLQAGVWLGTASLLCACPAHLLSSCSIGGGWGRDPLCSLDHPFTPHPHISLPPTTGPWITPLPLLNRPLPPGSPPCHSNQPKTNSESQVWGVSSLAFFWAPCITPHTWITAPPGPTSPLQLLTLSFQSFLHY